MQVKSHTLTPIQERVLYLTELLVCILMYLRIGRNHIFTYLNIHLYMLLPNCYHHFRLMKFDFEHLCQFLLHSTRNSKQHQTLLKGINN